MISSFDIGGSAIKYAPADVAGQLGEVRRVPTPLHDFEAFAAAIGALVASAPGHSPSRGVAISLAGVIDPADGRIQCANIPCIHGRTLAADLSVRLQLPVWIVNDADSFALAEARAGAGRGYRQVFGLILGTGVGGGIVIDGQLLTGPGGFAGEWGHGPAAAHLATYAADAPPVAIPRFACGCGQSGCLDTIGGARGLERLHRAIHPALHATTLDSTAIVAAWQAGDSAAAQTVGCWADLLSGPLAMLVNTLGAAILPVGGGLSNARSLITLLDTQVRARILRKTTAPLLVPAGCPIEPGLIGAAWLGLGELKKAAPSPHA